MQAMILAAGLGTRMRPLTDHTPKPLLKAAGKPLLEHQLERLIQAGTDTVVINTSYLAEQIEAFIAARNWPLNIRLSCEKQPLETAGGIRYALSQGLLSPEQPLLLVNGDIWCDYDLRRLPDLAPGQLGHLVLTDNPEHNPRGDFLLTPDGRVHTQNPQTPVPAAQALTFSGISLLHPALLPAGDSLQPLALGPLLKAAAEQGRISGEYHSGYWLDVGTPERLQQLEQHLGR